MWVSESFNADHSAHVLAYYESTLQAAFDAQVRWVIEQRGVACTDGNEFEPWL